VERWEDPSECALLPLRTASYKFSFILRSQAYRKCFSKLLTTSWKQHDPFDGTYRLDANMDLYKGQGAVRSISLSIVGSTLDLQVLRSAMFSVRGKVGSP
jgi:hypothetical protein